jgi:tetratricopeptide (TPR) repeat protein
VTRNPINGRFLLRTLVVVVLAGVGMHLVHTWQMGQHARGQLTQADQVEEEWRQAAASGTPEAGKHLDRAAAALKRSLAFAPNDLSVRTRYGLMLARRADNPRARWVALEALRQVLRMAQQAHQPLARTVRQEMVKLALELNQFAEAGKHLDVLLRQEPERGDLCLLQARCAVAQGDPGRAREVLEQAVRRVPKEIDAHVLLAELLYQDGQVHKANKVLARMVEQNPRSARAYLARARHHWKHGGLDSAETDLARARQFTPDALEILTASAELAQQRDQLDAAARHWSKGIVHHPKSPAGYLGLAGLERGRKQPQAAIVCLKKGLEAIPDQPDLLFALADLLVDERKLAGARKVFTRLGRAGTSLPVRYLEGRALVVQGRWSEAARVFEQVSAGTGVSQQLASRAQQDLARCLARLGLVDRQLDAARRAVALDPSRMEARAMLGELLLKLGRNEEALPHFRALAALPQTARSAWPSLARTLIQHNLLLPSAQRNWREVEEILDKAERVKDGLASVALVRAEMWLARNAVERARGLLEKERSARPKHLPVWLALADLEARQGNVDRAVAIWRETGKQLGDGLEWRLALVSLVMRHRGISPDVLEEMEQDLSRWASGDRDRLLRALLDAQARLGNGLAVERLGRQLLKLYPEDVQAHLLLLDAEIAKGDSAATGRLLADLRRVEGPEGAGYCCAEAARRLVESGGTRSGLTEARRLLAEAGQRRPSWSRVALLEAQLDEREGKPEPALRSYLRALDLGAYEPGVVRRAVRLLVAGGRYVEADRIIQRGQLRGVVGRDDLHQATEVALRAGNLDRAGELARQAVPAGTRDFRDLLWLGQVLATIRQHSEAEEAFRAAVELASYAPETWLALIAHLARTGQDEQVEVVLAEMKRELVPGGLPLALARAFEVLGHPGKAEREYGRAVAQQPRDRAVLEHAARFYVRMDQPARAEPLLRTLLDPRTLTPAADFPGWRRQLALVLSADGRFEQALTLLAQNRVGGESETVADRRVRALVLASRASERRAALRTLQGLPLGNAEEIYRLAQLYEAEGNWSRTRELLLMLLNHDSANPAYLSRYINGLLVRGKKAEAELWLARLEKLEPGSERTRALRARLRKKGDAAR